MCETVQTASNAVHYAAQLGRLDFLSAALAVLGILIGLIAIIAFIHFRRVAKKEAKDVSKQVAKKAAEKAANKYIQENLLDILTANAHLFNGSVDDKTADEIANAQDDEVSK